MTEAELLALVLEAAAEVGVLAHHSGDSRADAGDRGFPDLVLLARRLEFWELKSEVGNLDHRQAYWAVLLRSAEVTHRTVRPEHWPDEIYAWLREIRGREEIT